ncbi:H-NS family nucleoid-associated regulatory protein [Paraburkholderia sp. SIMBA_049]
MTTLEKVQTQIVKLQARADELISKQSSTVIAKIRDLMDKHGLTIADIDTYSGGKKRGRPAGVKTSMASKAAVAKYRDPKTGATWSGHGRAPAWIASAKDRTRFLADASAGISVPVRVAAKRAGNYARGTQPAKYRDPITGATWSGRGRAPAWLAGAKDLSSFLITGAAEVAESAAAVPAKKAGAKRAVKVAAKKAVARKATIKKAAGAKKAAAKKSVAKTAVAAKSGVKKAAAPDAKAAAKKATEKKIAAKGPNVTRKAAKKIAVKKAAKAAETGVETPAAPSGETVATAA